MKKFANLFCIIFIFTVLKSNAQNYLINFAGSGATTEVSTVKVENSTKGTSLTLNGNDILRLTFTTGVNSIENGQLSELKIYPNPMLDFSIVEVFPQVGGEALISVYEISGKPVVKFESYLENLRQGFRLSGLKKGFYIVNVKGINYQFSGKIVSDGESNGTISIGKVYSIIQGSNETSEKTEQADSKSTQSTVDMEYTPGERLKFTGISGNYSTVITDIPKQDKTITFNFILCNDIDNNYYPVIDIGNQSWMAANLKTVKYNDGAAIPLYYLGGDDGYGWYNNDPVTYKDKYGGLYNWLAVNTGKLCPDGWHVPTDEEMTILTDYLTDNGYGYESGGNDIAKSLASTTDWITFTTPGTAGNDQASNNSSGFTALPGGYESYRFVWAYIGTASYWWSATDAGGGMGWGYYIFNDESIVHREPVNNHAGLSIRCLKD